MTFLTIFSAPKPFTNPHIDLIQRNAIQSWPHLGEEVEVLLIGDEPGIADVAAEFGVWHVPDVEKNYWGTPLVSSIFARARQTSQSPVMAYVNADIILMPDFLQACRLVSSQMDWFLIVGQRWDLDLSADICFTGDWDRRLVMEVAKRGRKNPSGMDYFVFPRQSFAAIPDFAIGRAGWDNWMIYHARQHGWPVVDVTPSVVAVHQNHDYSHLPGGKPHYDLEESQYNVALAGEKASLYLLLDADRELVGGRIRPPRISLLRVLRRAEWMLMPVDRSKSRLRWPLVRCLRRWRRAIIRART
jgi:hypothetical protein